MRIPDSVTEIDWLAFWGCNNLKSVEIPAGTEVDKYAFPEHTLVTRRKAPNNYMGKSRMDELFEFV